MLAKFPPGVNFTNILHKPLFRMKIFCTAFMCLQFGFVIFWQKDFGAKVGHKMSVKLQPGMHKQVQLPSLVACVLHCTSPNVNGSLPEFFHLGDMAGKVGPARVLEAGVTVCSGLVQLRARRPGSNVKNTLFSWSL
jgi:hypothetical protein